MEKPAGIVWEIRNGIGIITIDNPPKNYLASPGLVPLETLRNWTSDVNLKGILITGAGKQFSAGGDLEHLEEMIRNEQDPGEVITRGKSALDFLENLDIPVVAAIKGVCFGGGLEIALASHIRICSDNALFAFPETNHGLIPGLGGTIRSVRQIGYARSLQMILGGDMIDAHEALKIGLVDMLVERKELQEFAFTYLHRMVHDRPLPVIRAVMKVLRSIGKRSPDEVMRLETELFCELASGEARRRREGIREQP